MKTLYPTLIAILIIGTVANAQNVSYAINAAEQTKTSYSIAPSESDAPFIKVRARTDKKILLTWMPFQGAVSHYVLERSTDGRSYQESGIFFTGDWQTEPAYFFTDKFHKAYAGPLYYRLRVVGLDGSVIYTPVTLLDAAGQL